MAGDDLDKDSSTHKNKNPKPKVPFILTGIGQLLSLVFFLGFIIVSAILLGRNFVLLVGPLFIVYIIFITKQILKVRRIQESMGDKEANLVKGLRRRSNEIKELVNLPVMVEWRRNVCWWKVGLKFGLVLIVFVGILIVGVTLGPIVAGGLTLIVLVVNLKAEVLSFKFENLDSFSFSKLKNTFFGLTNICLIVIRDIFLAVVSCGFWFLLLTPMVRIASYSIQHSEIGWARAIRLALTVACIIVGGFAVAFWDNLKKSSKDDDIDNEYLSEIERHKEKLKLQILPEGRLSTKIGLILLRQPTMFFSILAGVVISTFAQASLLGGAGNLSDVSPVEALKFTTQAFLDTLLQDFSKIFHVPLSSMIPLDFWARLYNWMTRFTMLVLLFLYINGIRFYVRNKSVSRAVSKGET